MLLLRLVFAVVLLLSELQVLRVLPVLPVVLVVRLALLVLLVLVVPVLIVLLVLQVLLRVLLLVGSGQPVCELLRSRWVMRTRYLAEVCTAGGHQLVTCPLARVPFRPSRLDFSRVSTRIPTPKELLKEVLKSLQGLEGM